MSETVTESQELVEATPVQYPEVALLKPCSTLTCLNGHEWIPTLALAKCGYGTPQGWNGCGTPLLALRMTTCPTCQEPIKKFRLRVDITAPCPFPQPLCIPGTVPGNAEHLTVEIEPEYWKQTEEEYHRQEQKKVENNTTKLTANEFENTCESGEPPIQKAD